jgi:hypothetical protein
MRHRHRQLARLHRLSLKLKALPAHLDLMRLTRKYRPRHPPKLMLMMMMMILLESMKSLRNTNLDEQRPASKQAPKVHDVPNNHQPACLFSCKSHPHPAVCSGR